MRSIAPLQAALPNQYQQPQTAAMVLVRMPDGGMGWVPQAAMQAALGQAPAAPAGGLSPTIKTLLIAGGLGLVGWWAYKKWFKFKVVKSGVEYVQSRRRSRSRSRMMAEFQRFLDSSGPAHEADEECTECAEEDIDPRDVQVEGGVNY